MSRFQGNERDGHGNHQTAGLMTQQAFEAAGDPKMFPEQIQAGLRPWQAQKVYIGGVREDEDWTVRIDSGEYSPWLGDSFDNFARNGLSFQRSQNSGRLTLVVGSQLRLLQARRSPGPPPARRNRTSSPASTRSIPGLFKALGRPEPAGAAALLQPIDAAVQEAMRTVRRARSVGHRADARARAGRRPRAASDKLGADPDAALILDRKVEQFQIAINTALGLDLTAVAQPAGLPEPTGPWRRLRAAAGHGRRSCRARVSRSGCTMSNRGRRVDSSPRRSRSTPTAAGQ